MGTFPNALTSKRDKFIFFNKLDLDLVSGTYIIRKFKMLSLPNKSRY